MEGGAEAPHPGGGGGGKDDMAVVYLNCRCRFERIIPIASRKFLLSSPSRLAAL